MAIKDSKDQTVRQQNMNKYRVTLDLIYTIKKSYIPQVYNLFLKIWMINMDIIRF